MPIKVDKELESCWQQYRNQALWNLKTLELHKRPESACSDPQPALWLSGDGEWQAALFPQHPFYPSHVHALLKGLEVFSLSTFKP